MTRHTPRYSVAGTVLGLGVSLTVLAWGLFVGFGVVGFLRAGRVVDVATFIGAVAVVYAGVLTLPALAYRIADAVRDEYRATRRQTIPGPWRVQGRELRQPQV
jgi:hypothetical protein